MVGETSGPDTEAAAAAAAALAAQVASSASQDRPNPSTSLSHSIDKLDGTMATGQSNVAAENWNAQGGGYGGQGFLSFIYLSSVINTE